MKKPTFSNKKVTSENKYLRTIQRDFIDSEGRAGNIITLESQTEGNGSFVLALTKDKKIILNKEYKFGPDRFIYVFPSGWIEKGLTGEENIKKELKEEAGYGTDEEIVYIGKVMQNAYINVYNEGYFAKNCYPIGERQAHEGEEIETYLFDIGEIDTMFQNNKILDPYTVALYYMMKEKTNNFRNLNI